MIRYGTFVTCVLLMLACGDGGAAHSIATLSDAAPDVLADAAFDTQVDACVFDGETYPLGAVRAQQCLLCIAATGGGLVWETYLCPSGVGCCAFPGADGGQP